MCKISVVTSVWNGEKYIGETIMRVRNQTFTDWEYIIIDNCSDDRTAEIVQKHVKKDSRIKFIQNDRNLGISPNLNKGIRLAKGRYIARLDHDDLCYPRRLEVQYQYMETHPEILLSGCGADQWIKGKIYPGTNAVKAADEKEVRFAMVFAFFSIMAHSTFFFRRQEIIDKGIWYRDLKYVEDLAFIFDTLRAGKAGYLPEPLIAYRIHGAQVTKNLSAVLKFTEQRDVFFEYLNAIDVRDKEIVRKAFLGSIEGEKDMRRYAKAMADYAETCGIKGNLAENACVRQMYRRVFDRQRCGLKMLSVYGRSPLREPAWFFKRRGLSLIRQCVLKEDKMEIRLSD